MKRTNLVQYILIAVATSILCLSAVAAEPDRQGIDIKEFGPTPLYWQWKFCVGDSPWNPATRAPLWADADFDDSAWETLTLWPNNWTDYPGAREHAYIPGWTARGHAGYWGYAWYRVRVVVRLHTQAQWLAIAPPDRVEDAYQLFLNGTLVGHFGDFKGGKPTTYDNPPPYTAFYVPPSRSSTGTLYPLVFAIRVWMGPGTLSTSYEPGGLRSKPILGTADEIQLDYERSRGNLIASQQPLIVCAGAFSLLAILAFSFTMFANSDRVYVWMGVALALMAISSELGSFVVKAQLGLSILEDRIIVHCFLWPLVYLVWLVVWSMWFGREKAIWTLAGSAPDVDSYHYQRATRNIWIFFRIRWPIFRPPSDVYHLAVLGGFPRCASPDFRRLFDVTGCRPLCN